MAVAAKASVLREMGVEVPEVIAVERIGVGANWQASGGWTDGAHRLGTSPEKDVGFPYRSALVPRRNAELDERMTRYSWQSYLIATGVVRRMDRPRQTGADSSPVEPIPGLGRRPDRPECGAWGGRAAGRQRRPLGAAHPRDHRARRRLDDHRARARPKSRCCPAIRECCRSPSSGTVPRVTTASPPSGWR